MKNYNWPGLFKPFDHQVETASFLVMHKKAFCFNEMGTGKTSAVVWASDYLMTLGVVKRVLVICPLSIMKSAWQADIFKTAMHRSCEVCHGTANKRRQILAQNTEFVIINFDGIGVVKKEIVEGGFDLIVVDEANAFKTASSQRHKQLTEICKHVKGLWMLTGTPAAQSPTDAYGLAKLVNPNGVPRFFGAFRDKVMRKYGPFKWVPKENATDEVHKVLQPAIRFEKRQCIDLPAITYTDREIPMTPQQNKYYKELKKEMLIQASGDSVTSANAAVLLTKLLQIASGTVYADSGDVLEFDVSNRLNELKSVVEESEHKVLVFVPFTHTIRLVQEFLEHEGVSAEMVDGSVNFNKRSDIIDRFQKTDQTKVLILQPKAASHGLTLTAADTIVWYAPVTSVETYMQANGRIDRPGQKNKMTIVHLKGSPVENRIYAMLRNNITEHETLIDLYKKEMDE